MRKGGTTGCETSDNELQRVVQQETMNDNELQGMVRSGYFG